MQLLRIYYIVYEYVQQTAVTKVVLRTSNILLSDINTGTRIYYNLRMILTTLLSWSTSGRVYTSTVLLLQLTTEEEGGSGGPAAVSGVLRVSIISYVSYKNTIHPWEEAKVKLTTTINTTPGRAGVIRYNLYFVQTTAVCVYEVIISGVTC